VRLNNLKRVSGHGWSGDGMRRDIGLGDGSQCGIWGFGGIYRQELITADSYALQCDYIWIHLNVLKCLLRWISNETAFNLHREEPIILQV
jgi:hypothetical protein